MSIPLFKADFKKNRLVLLAVFAMLSMYTTVMVWMFDPVNMDMMKNLIKMLPDGLMKGMGFTSDITELTGYLASWLYGLLMLAFPLVYSTIIGNRLVARMTDDHSLACLLSTPNSRAKIIITQGVYALGTLAALAVAVFGMAVTISATIHPGLLDVYAFLRLNVTTMLVNMSAMMICFFFSCLMNESEKAVGLGAGIPILFLLMNVLGNSSKSVEILKKLSLYGLYNPVAIVRGGSALTTNTVYILCIVMLFAASVLVFSRKPLAI